jgi:hypothetical protein
MEPDSNKLMTIELSRSQGREAKEKTPLAWLEIAKIY